MASFDEAQEARFRLLCKIGSYRNVNGAGLARDDLGWFVKVNLIKHNRWWHRKLPFPRFNGVRVRYEVVGKIVAY